MDAMRIPVVAFAIVAPRSITDLGAFARYSGAMGVVLSNGDVRTCEGKSGDAISMQGTAPESVSRRRCLVTASIVKICISDSHSFDKKDAISVIVSAEPRPLI
jgi:hypothetical protein